MANLIPESGDGTIDRELLRDKFTGRSKLFFREDNAGGVRSHRKAINFVPDTLQLDPAVKYRAFGSQTAADDFLKTGLIAGRGGYENALYFNQGVPLLSYAETNTPNQRFLLATLGDEWGDRNGTTFGKNARPAGLGLTPAQDANAFQVTPPIIVPPSPYTEKIGDLTAPDLKKFKTLKDLAKYAKGLDLKYYGKAAGTEKGLPRPAVYPDRRVSLEDYQKEHLPKLTEIKGEVTKIADYLLSPEVQETIRILNEREKGRMLPSRSATSTLEPNPLLEYYKDFFRVIDDGHLRGIQDQNHGGRYPVQLPKYDETWERDIFDSSPENVKKLKALVKTNIDGFLDSTISQDLIVPFDRQLSYFPDGVRDNKLPNAFGTFTEPTPLELAYLKKYHKEGSTWLQHGVPQHTAGVMNNPANNPYGIEGFATTARSSDLAAFLETTRKFFDPAKFHTNFALEDTPEQLPFGDFHTRHDGLLQGGEWVDRNARELVPMTPQEGLYVPVGPQVQHSVTTPSGLSNLLRVTPRDEGLFSTPQGVLSNLNNVFDQSLRSWGNETKIRDLEVPTMGLGGAMYSEVLPTAQVLGTYLDPTTGQQREWQTLAPAINPQDGHRPAVLFQIMDDGSHKILKQYNNDPTSEGWTPIPTKTLAPDKQKEAYVRYLQEMTGDVAGGRAELLGLRRDIFWEIYPELPKGGAELTPEEVQAAFGNLTEEQLGAAASRLMARGIWPSQTIDSKHGNYPAYLPKSEGYKKLGGLIDEATRGNPNYGRKGFINLNSLTSPFKNLNKYLTEIPMPEGMPELSRSVVPKGAKVDMLATLRKHYLTNPNYRNALNISTLGKAGTVAAIATTPFDSVSRKESFNRYLVGQGATAEDLWKMHLPLAVASGLETAANFGTFGMYDAFSPSPSSVERRQQFENDYFRQKAIRDYIQQGIDYPVIGGQRFERTTK